MQSSDHTCASWWGTAQKPNKALSVPILRSRPLCSCPYRTAPNDPAHEKKHPPSSHRRSQTPTTLCNRFPTPENHPLSSAQSTQSSKAAGSFVARDESAQPWCSYRETRKQEEHGRGGHISARAKRPQDVSGRPFVRRVVLRRRNVLQGSSKTSGVGTQC
jgi:hypothetical protein